MILSTLRSWNVGLRSAGFIFMAAVSALAAAPRPVPVHFEPNRGQASSSVEYVAETPGSVMLVGNTTLTLSSSVQLQFDGASINKRWEASERTAGTTSWIVGRGDHFYGIPHYSRLSKENLYPGIDLVLYGGEGRLEYDLILAPGADPRQIRVRFAGEAPPEITGSGDLRISSLVQNAPVLFQTRPDGTKVGIEGHYVLLSPDTVGFSIGAYDRNLPLTIDPVLVSASLLGGSADDRVFGVDPTGALGAETIVGSTSSPDFPGLGIYKHSGVDVFIYVPSTDNTVIVGGSGDEIVTSVSGNGLGSFLVIGGYTNSLDFPTVAPYSTQGILGSVQTNYGGGSEDGFLLVLANSYVTPYLSTYYGGSGDDRILAVNSSAAGYAFAGSTTSDDFPLVAPVQSTRGGGTDGFLALIPEFGIAPTFSTYLGGSGDDSVLALTASANHIYAAGRTASSDWKPSGWAGARGGPSDGFAALFVNGGNGLYTLSGGTWIGGSGDDQVTALAETSDSKIVAVGVTTSTDFAPAGTVLPLSGPSDAFLLKVSPDLQTALSATLIGGSGDEQPLAVTVSQFNEILIGGWTSSPDFPQSDSFQPQSGQPQFGQPQFGGGDSDGFLYCVDSSGRTVFSTYYGGSGSDRITTVAFDQSQLIYFGGITSSPNLALPNGIQTGAAGGTDGFYGTFSESVIHADNVVGGKDLTGTLLAVLGDTSNYIGTPLTATTGDPSRLLLGANAADTGQTSVTISVRSGANIAARSFNVYCLTDSGTVPLTLTAPGYPTQTVNVQCVPSALAVNWPSATANGVTVTSVYLDPATGNPIAAQLPRPGLSYTIGATTPNIALVQLQQQSLILNSYSGLAGVIFYYSVTGSGNTEIDLTSSGPTPIPSAVIPIHAGSALSLYIPQLAQDLAATISAYSVSSPSIVVTYTSSDPSKVLLYTPGGAPQTSVTAQSYSTVYASVLKASGSVSITATAPGFLPVTTPVTFAQAGIAFENNYGSPINGIYTAPGIYELYFALFAGSPSNIALGYTGYRLRPGVAPVQVALTSSDPTVVSVPATMTIYPDQAIAPLVVNAAGTGSATISLTSASLSIHSSIAANVTGHSLVLNSLTLGSNLESNLTAFAYQPSAASTQITFSSSDPSRVVLSTDATVPGQGTLTIASPYSNLNIVVQSLGPAGDVPVTMSAAGYSPVTATVHVVPSALIWSSNLATIQPALPGSAQIYAVALDPATLAPVLQQTLRPGLSGSVQFQNSNPGVVSAPDLPFPATGGSLKEPLTASGFGDAFLGIAQPSGFTPPVATTPLHVQSTLGDLQLYLPNVGVNLQIAASPPYSATPVPITLTSTNPSVLAISRSVTDLGGASALMDRTVYFQGLAGPSDVTITASAPGYNSFSTVVQTEPVDLAFTSYGSLAGDASVQISAQQTPYQQQIGAIAQGPQCCTASGGTLRAGLDPIVLQINSSNPSVAGPAGPVQLDPLTATTTVPIQGYSTGTTALTITPPPGFIPAAPGAGRTVNVTVLGAAFALPNLTLSPDLQIAANLAAMNAAQTVPNAVDFTIASGDPSRVLLSADGLSSGSATLTVHFNAGDPASRRIFLQGLGNGGLVTIQTSAPGYQTSTSTVTLTGTAFAANPTSINLFPGDPQSVTVMPTAAGVNPFNPSLAYQLRPGANPITLGIASGNTAVASVSPAQLTFLPGMGGMTFTVTPAASGTASIGFTAPPGVTPPAAIAVTVQSGFLQLNSSVSLGRDLQAVVSVQLYNGTPAGAPVTLTSADPARLLISTSAALPGQASVTLSGTSSILYYLQALGNSGTVTITASAPGFTSTTATVALSNPEVVLSSSANPASLTLVSAPLTLNAVFAASASGYTAAPMSLRPGASPISVQVSLTNTAVGSVSPSQLTFNPGETQQTLTFQPLASGSTLLSLSVPAGFADPLNLRQELIDVSPVRFGFSTALSVGKDLWKTTALTLPSPAGPPLTATITSSDPTRLLLYDSPTASSGASLQVTFSAGSYNSASFGLIGLDSGGSATITVSAPPLAPVTYSVALNPTGFLFSQTQSSLSVGRSAAFTVQAAELSPGILTMVGVGPLRPGLQLNVPVSSSDPTIAAPASSGVPFKGGDLSEPLTVNGISKGTATLTLTPPAGYSSPASGASAQITVQ